MMVFYVGTTVLALALGMASFHYQLFPDWWKKWIERWNKKGPPSR